MFRRFLKFRLAGLVVAWLAALVIVLWLLFAGREVAFERGRRATTSFAAVVQQQTARTFQAVRLTLGAIADAEYLLHPAKHDRDFRRLMARRLTDVPYIRAVFVIGRDGSIIHDTDYPNTPAVSLADRPYFRAHADQPALEQSVWPPLASRSGMGYFLPFTRALASDGAFAGVVVAAVQADYFERQLAALGLPDGYLVSLFHTDGTMVASYPQIPGGVGTNYRRLPLFARLAAEDSGSFWTNQGLVPGMRLVSYRVLEDAPFVVRVSRAREDMLVEWRRTATAALLAMAALTFFLGWMIVRLARDSTRRALERERRSQAEKLEALGQLSGGMAHDFANALNVVAMNVEVVRTNRADPRVVDAGLAAMERAVRSGRGIAERLLTFARRRPLALAPVRLDRWLETARPFLAQAVGPRMSLSMQSEQPVPEVLCDPVELDVALVNLLANARDATAGAGQVSVRVFACSEESGAPVAFVGKPARFVCLSVRDDGPGMTEEVRRRALEPFYSTKGDAGTGLGLAQVYGLMRQLGGHLTIDSAPGKGTAVHLFFPVAPVAVARA